MPESLNRQRPQHPLKIQPRSPNRSQRRFHRQPHPLFSRLRPQARRWLRRHRLQLSRHRQWRPHPPSQPQLPRQWKPLSLPLLRQRQSLQYSPVSRSHGYAANRQTVSASTPRPFYPQSAATSKPIHPRFGAQDAASSAPVATIASEPAVDESLRGIRCWAESLPAFE